MPTTDPTDDERGDHPTDRRSFLGAVGASALPLGVGSANATADGRDTGTTATAGPSISSVARIGEDDGDAVYELQGEGFGTKDHDSAVLYDFVTEAYENGTLNTFAGDFYDDGQDLHTATDERMRVYDGISTPGDGQDSSPTFVTDEREQSHRHDGVGAHYRFRDGAYLGLPMAYGGDHEGTNSGSTRRYERPEGNKQLYIAWWLRPALDPWDHLVVETTDIDGSFDFGASKRERGERVVVPGAAPAAWEADDWEGWLVGKRDGDGTSPNDDGRIEIEFDPRSNPNLLAGETLEGVSSGATAEIPGDAEIDTFTASEKLLQARDSNAPTFGCSWQVNGLDLNVVDREYWGVAGSPTAREWNLLEFVADIEEGWLEGWVNFQRRDRIEWDPAKTATTDSPTLQLLGMHTGTFGYQTFRVSEIYQDSAVQRVVVADAETLAEATHYELQRPTEWSDDRVRFALTTGQLPDDEQLYVFVFDDDGQVSGRGEPLTRPSAGTTIVADRAPDGSRLTSRPDGPAAHRTDGTVHLFTWDQPGPGARAVLYDEDDSTDWGEGPDVHLYDTMEREGVHAGDVPSRVATRGRWETYSGLPELHPNAHSGEFSARIQNQDTLHKFEAGFPGTTEVFLSYCVKIPEGKAMPGTEQPGEFPDESVWKMAWLYNDAVWAGDDDVDIVLPTWNAGGTSLIGNNLHLDVDVADSKHPDWWLWGEWMRFSLWLECGENPATDSGRVRWQVVSEGEQTQVVADGEDEIMEDGQPPYAWRRLTIPGWSQNRNVSGDAVEVLYDDIYLATGADANARVELSDDVAYGDSTRIQLCDVRSWSPNRVSVRLRTGSIESIDDAAVHLTTAQETQAVSMEVN